MDEQRDKPTGEEQTGAAAASDKSGPSVEAGAAAESGADKPAAENVHVPARSEAVRSANDGSARSGKVTIMAPAPKDWYRHWDDEIEVEAPDEPRGAAGQPGKRKLATVAAIVILAALAGAIGGAVATAGLTHVSDVFAPKQATAKAEPNPLDAQMAQMKADIAALKDSVDHASKLSVAQIGKATERLDRIEKAQAEPVAKIAKLTETVEKLRTAQAQPPAPVAAPAQVASAAPPEVTGTIAPKTEPAKPQTGRLPTVEGWVLRDVYDGGALIEGRGGRYEVYAGDPVPGLGRVDAIRRQDGRWVVVTSRGLIVAR